MSLHFRWSHFRQDNWSSLSRFLEIKTRKLWCIIRSIPPAASHRRGHNADTDITGGSLLQNVFDHYLRFPGAEGKWLWTSSGLSGNPLIGYRVTHIGSRILSCVLYC